MTSAAGSASNTASTLFVKKIGNIKINGINKITFRSNAKNRE